MSGEALSESMPHDDSFETGEAVMYHIGQLGPRCPADTVEAALVDRGLVSPSQISMGLPLFWGGERVHSIDWRMVQHMARGRDRLRDEEQRTGVGNLTAVRRVGGMRGRFADRLNRLS